MVVVEKNGDWMAICEAKGQRRPVNLMLLAGETVEIDDYLSVQMGNAISKISREDAVEVWKIYDELLDSEVKVQTLHGAKT